MSFERKGAWDALRGGAPETVEVDGVELRRGSRVRLRPRPGGDVFDLALTGREAVVEGIEQDLEGVIALTVTVDDDPGRDLGALRRPGHRFFFSPAEVEPLPGAAATRRPAQILVAGIGNVFLGDDGFGVALAERLAERPQPDGVRVVDFGIRGMELAYALHDGYDAVVLLDATPRGGAPGTLYVIEPEPGDAQVALDAHGMDPVKVLALAQELGGPPPRTLVVGCEPQHRMTGDEQDVVASVSAPVQAALDEAVVLVEQLLDELTDDQPQEAPPS